MKVHLRKVDRIIASFAASRRSFHVAESRANDGMRRPSSTYVHLVSGTILEAIAMYLTVSMLYCIDILMKISPKCVAQPNILIYRRSHLLHSSLPSPSQRDKQVKAYTYDTKLPVSSLLMHLCNRVSVLQCSCSWQKQGGARISKSAMPSISLNSRSPNPILYQFQKECGKTQCISQILSKS